MSLMSRISNRLRRDYFQWRYRSAAARIGQTQPLQQGSLPFMLLSMVQKRDVHSYLVAVKSFARFVNPIRIVVVCDPSIDDEDRSILMSQVPHIELRSAADFLDPDIPRGGCWERLFAISEYSKEHYVVQLDADTITTSDIAEVRHAVSSSSGFVLGEEQGQGLLSVVECSARASLILKPDAHIQTLSESVMADIGLPRSALYVRGCAGFTGFPPDGLMRERLLDYSRRMTERLGRRWASWGTEQVTSNYLVANAVNTSVLPFPKYGTPDQATEETVFLHFIGSMRFINSKYEAATESVVRELRT